MSMEFVKTGERDWDLIVPLLGITLLVLGLSFLMYMSITSNSRREAHLADYQYVTSITERFPELRDDINQCKADGVLTNGEVRTLREKTERISRSRELEKIE